MATATKTKRASPTKKNSAHRGNERQGGRRRWRHYTQALGPGLVTGASDDDPSGIATYAQAGAKFGFGLLWSALVTLPLMAAVQEMCDRTALVTGKGIGELAAKCFTKAWRVVLGVLLVGAAGRQRAEHRC